MNKKLLLLLIFVGAFIVMITSVKAQACASICENFCEREYCPQGYNYCLGAIFCRCMGNEDGDCWMPAGGCVDCSSLAHTAGCSTTNICNCAKGWKNCYNGWTDGCETDILNDENNCGGCNVKCQSGQNCINGVCIGGQQNCYEICSLLCLSRGYEDCYSPANPFCYGSCRCNCLAFWWPPPGNSQCYAWLGTKNCSDEGKTCQNGQCVDILNYCISNYPTGWVRYKNFTMSCTTLEDFYQGCVKDLNGDNVYDVLCCPVYDSINNVIVLFEPIKDMWMKCRTIR